MAIINPMVCCPASQGLVTVVTPFIFTSTYNVQICDNLITFTFGVRALVGHANVNTINLISLQISSERGNPAH